MSQRRLQVVLDLDTSQWTGRITTAGSQLRVFGGQVNNSNRSVRDMTSSFDRMGRSMSTPLQKLRDYTLIMGNVRFALINLRDIAVGWVASLVKQSAEVERLTILLKGMSSATTEAGRNKEAQYNFEIITKLAKTSGFAIQQLGDSFVKFKAGGLDPTDGSLKSLVDAVSAFGGSSETLQRASVAIQQMSGKGVISMEELRQQLGEAVPTALNVMAKAAGKSVDEFVKEVSLGKVKAAPALKGMFDEFARMYAGSGYRLSQTLNGQLAQVKTNMLEISNEFTQLRSKADAQGNVTTSGAQGGLYDTITKSVKELNKALSSQEGKDAARQLGEAVNSIAKGLIYVTKTAIEWRSTIGTALTAVAAGFVFLKSVAVMTWMVESLMASRAAMTGLSASVAAGTGPISIMVQRTGAYAAALRAKNFGLQRSAVLASANAAASTRNVAAINSEIANLNRLRAAHILQARESQRAVIASTAALQAGRASGRYRDYETGQIISQQRALEKNSLAHLANAQAKNNLSRTARNLTASKFALATATNAETAALGVNETAARAAATATNFMGRAKLFAAGAARALGVAMSFALGPIGMIAIALGFAAYQAGVFTSKASAAADAARDLAAGIGTLAQAKQVQNRLDANLAEQRTLDAADAGLSNANIFGKQAKDKEREKRRAALKTEEASLTEKLNKGLPKTETKLGRERAANILSSQEDMKAQWAGDYNSGKITKEEFDRRSAEVPAAAIASIQAMRDKAQAAGKSTAYFDGALQTLRGSADAVVPAVKGAGDAIFGGGKKKMSEAEKEANRLATAFDNAREKYKTMIGNQDGEIAELEAEIGGAEGALAKFQAREKAGLFRDATKEEIAQLVAGFIKIDEATEKLNFDRSLRGLNKEIAQTTAQANQMWESLRKGGNSFEQDSRSAQVKGQFADKLAGLTDPEKIAEVNRLIKEATANLYLMDAAVASRNWELMTEEIRISLMGENDARQANFNLEVERQRSLINWATLTGDKKIEAERRFEGVRAALQQRQARENESSTVKMARDWAKLGQNIDGALSGALSSFVDGMFEADLNFGKFAISIIKNLIKIIIQAAIAYAIMSALGLANNSAGQPVSFRDYMKGQVGGGFGGGGNASNPTNIGYKATPVKVGTNHTGGFIGSSKHFATVAGNLFNNAKTYHNGGMIGGRQLRPGEVPIIGMKGEQVLTEAQQRAMRDRSGGMPSVQVNIINNSGQQLDAEQGEPQFDAKDMILNVVLDAASRRGPFRDAMKGMNIG